MKKKLGKILVILGVISATVNLMSCANMSNVEVKQYAESESKREEELNKEISKVRESKEDNRTETIIGGKEEAKDKEEETVGKEPETYEYTTNEAGEKVYRVYDEYLGEEVENPKLYKDEYYIGEGKGKKVPTYDTLADKWANYSDGVKKIIEKYEGKDVYRDLIGSDGRIKNYDQMKKEAQLLADNDLYIVGFNTWGMPITDLIKGFKDYNKGNDTSKTWTEEEILKDVNYGTIQIMTWDEATKWGLNFYNKYGDRQEAEIKGIGEAVIIPQAFGVNNQGYDKRYNDYPSPITNASHLYNANYQHEVYTQRQEYLNQYVLRNETAGSPAKFINALGGREYFRDEVSGNVYTKDGQQANFDGYYGVNWCKSRGVDSKDYREVEMIVFKKNNPDVKFGDLPYSYSHIKYKVYHQGGEPRWIERDRNAYTYNVFGVKMYPDVYKSFDRYLQYCGGVKVNGEVVAFKTWNRIKWDDKQYNWYYNGVLQKGEGSEYELSVRGDYLVDNVKENNNLF